MKKYNLILLLVVALFASCMEEPIVEPNTNMGNFESLWRIIDTKYCYLDYKQINWDSIYTAYKAKITEKADAFVFFDLMVMMLNELKDGHVNLYSNFDRSRYWKWYTDYPANFNVNLIHSARYLGNNYKIANGLSYQKIANGRVGYIYLGSFSYGFNDANIVSALNYFKDCKGLIIDVRDNSGGSLDYSRQLTSCFFKEEKVTGYIKHKIGNGHTDFSKALEVKTPAHKYIQYLRQVVVLTNRMSFSATNDFVNRMKQAPNVLVVGDKTGGGGGLPLSSELPNGWLVRFSSSPMFDSDMQNIEWGIEPDVRESLKSYDQLNDIDTIIEKAITLIK